MAVIRYDALNDLQRKRTPRPPAPEQVAVVGLISGLLGKSLAELSRAGKALPARVPGYGALPPGDVINVHHYTPKAGLDVLDPAKWGSRSGAVGNKEASWVQGVADVQPVQAYLPDYGYTDEKLWGPTPTRIEGALPGMYNAQEDPLKLRDLVKERLQAERSDSLYPVTAPEVQQAFAREVQQRGFHGQYSPQGAAQGGTALIYDMVALGDPGSYPNIAELRAKLGRPNTPGDSLFPMDNATIAAITTETQPGKSLVPYRYRNYEKNPAAAWLLHRDYERLLRDPDTTSVVARYFDEEAPVYQGQGAFKGQYNPVSGARVSPSDSGIDMSRWDRAKMDAVAVVEGLLRDQDAAAWSRPKNMVPEDEIVSGATQRAALIRGKGLGAYELRQVADELNTIKAGNYRWDKKNPEETVADHIVVVPAPDGGPGLFLFPSNPGMPTDEFASIVKGVRNKFAKKWKDFGSTDLKTYWGDVDSGYIDSSEYNAVLNKLPTSLKMKAQKALQELSPAVKEIRDYHDRIRARDLPNSAGGVN